MTWLDKLVTMINMQHRLGYKSTLHISSCASVLWGPPKVYSGSPLVSYTVYMLPQENIADAQT